MMTRLTRHEMCTSAISEISLRRGLQVAARVLACLFIASLPAGPALAADGGPVVAVVFDASGSMWGRLEAERQSKLVLARDALKQSLAKLPKDASVSLLTFPGRRRADCSETETLLKPGPFAAERFGGALEKLNPKGKGPLVLGLKEAAALSPSDAPAAIILVHDDADNCGMDACTAAMELKQSHPRLAVHVVSLALKPEDVARSSCVATATGGTFANVRDQAGLQKATDDAVRLAARTGPARQPVVAGEVAKAAVPAAVVNRRTDGPPGLALAAKLKPGGPAIDVPLTWLVTDASRVDGQSVRAIGATPELLLRPGKYRVEVTGGLVRRDAVFDVGEKGLAAGEVNLDAGLVDLAVLARRGQAALEDAIVTIAPPGTGPRRLLLGSQAGLLVAAGAYEITVEQGALRQTTAVNVTAGERTAVEALLAFGTLQISIPAADPAVPVSISVQEDDPEARGGRREVARSGAARAEFRLPPGTYHVVGRAGESELREQVTVRSGEVTARDLPLTLASVSLQSKVRGGPIDRQDTIAYTIERTDRPASDRIRTGVANPTLVIAPGRYNIEVRLGDANAVVTRTLQVTSGRPQNVVIEHDSGRVKLRVAATTKAVAAIEPYWEVRTDAGQLIWTATAAEPSLWLKPGAYKVRANVRDRRVDSDLVVRAGGDHIFDVKLD